MLKPLAALLFAFLVVSPALASGAPVKGFAYDSKEDLFGYYMANRPVTSGKFTLHALSIGTRDELKKYESGKGRLPTWAPVMFSFQDRTSKKMRNELGQDYYANSPRVLPGGYRIREKTIVFVGRDKQIGTVIFTGTYDMRPLKDARTKGELVTKKPVIRGYLTIASKMHKNVAFTWFGGD